MKTISLTASCLLALLSLAVAQQRNFHTGAEWLRHPTYTNQIEPHPNWAFIREAGLRWGMFSINNTMDTQFVNGILTAANNNGVSVILDRGVFAWVVNRHQGFRWRYHPEYTAHYPGTGTVGTRYLDENGNPDLAADKDADAYTQPHNCWRAAVGMHQPGFLCSGLILNPEQVAGTCWVRVRLRLPDAPNVGAGIDVVTVRVLVDGQTRFTTTITTDALKRTPLTTGQGNALRSDNLYGEVLVGNFYHNANNPIDIQVEWHGLVTVHLDYVAVDDEEFKN